MSEKRSADTPTETESLPTAIPGWSEQPASAKKTEERLRRDGEPLDLPEAGEDIYSEKDHFVDAHADKHGPDMAGQTRVGGSSERTTDKHRRFKELNDTRSNSAGDRRMGEIEKERIVHGFAGQFDLTPHQRKDALAVVNGFDFATAGSHTLEHVALAAIKVVVNEDRFDHLGVDPNDDEAWISRSEEFTTTMEAVNMDGSALNSLSRKIKSERPSEVSQYHRGYDPLHRNSP